MGIFVLLLVPIVVGAPNPPAESDSWTVKTVPIAKDPTVSNLIVSLN